MSSETPLSSLTEEEIISRWIDAYHLRASEIGGDYDQALLEIPEEFREEVQAAEIARLEEPATGFAYFFRWYGWLRVKGRGAGYGWQRFCPGGKPRRDESTGKDYGWQIELALIFGLYDIFELLKARQLGVSFILANLVDWQAMFFPDQSIPVVANKVANAKRIVRSARNVYKRLPDWMTEYSPMINDALSNLEFKNGSRIEPMTGARSEAANLIVVDEAAFIDNFEDKWADIEAAAEGGGRIILVSTANGVGNFFHRSVVEAVAGEVEHVIETSSGYKIPVHYGENEMGFAFLPWHMSIKRDESWFAKKKKLYAGSLSKLYQEYPGSWEEAFILSGMSYFDMSTLLGVHEPYARAYEEYSFRVSLHWADKLTHSVEWRADPAGRILIHARPAEFAEILSSKRGSVIFADCAGDDPWGDSHAASAVHAGFGYSSRDDLVPEEMRVKHRQILTIHGAYDADVYAADLEKAAYLLGEAVVAIEANGVGIAVIHAMRNAGYKRLYRRKASPDKVKRGKRRILGWWSSNDTKHLAYGSLERMQREGEIEIRCLATVQEMSNVRFLGQSQIGVREPGNDDRADALAGCCAIIDEVKSPRYYDAVEREPEDTMARFLREARKERLAETFIGAE